MLALLSYIAYSAAKIETSTPSNRDACFDLTYYTSNGNNRERATTKNNQGFFVAYRVHEGDAYSELQLVKYSDQQKSEYNDLSVEFHQQTVNRYLELTFNITNKGYFPKIFDLGLFADIAYNNFDDAVLHLLEPKHAFQVEVKQQTLFFTVFINNPGRWDPVDTLLLGEMSDEEADEISEMPFFVNGDKALTSGDSVVAFSWQNKTVRPGETIQLGFLAHVSKDVTIAPGVIDQTVIKPSYEPNENLDIVFNITDFDSQQTIDYTITTSAGQTINKKWEREDGIWTKQFTHQVNVGTESIFTYTISAKDSKNQVSNTVSKKVFVYPQPVVKPIDGSLKPKYSQGQTIDLSVEVTSQNTFFLKYYFDDGRILTANEKTSARKVKENVKTFSIPITSEITADKSHALTYYVEDENGAQSEKQVHTFECTSQAEPEPEPVPGPDPQPEPTNDNNPEPVPGPGPDPQPEPTNDNNPEPVPGPGPDAQPEPTNDNNPEPEPDPQPEQTKKPDPQPEQTKKPEPQPEPKDKEQNNPQTQTSPTESGNNLNGGEVDNSKDNSNLGIIIGCVVAGIAVVVIIVIAVVFLIKKKSKDEISEEEAPSQTADKHYFEE